MSSLYFSFWFCTLILLTFSSHSHICTKRCNCCCCSLNNPASGSTERCVCFVFCFSSKPYIGFGQNKSAWHEQTEDTINHVSSLEPCSLKAKFKFVRSGICALAERAGERCFTPVLTYLAVLHPKDSMSLWKQLFPTFSSSHSACTALVFHALFKLSSQAWSKRSIRSRNSFILEFWEGLWEVFCIKL